MLHEQRVYLCGCVDSPPSRIQTWVRTLCPAHAAGPAALRLLRLWQTGRRPRRATDRLLRRRPW